MQIYYVFIDISIVERKWSQEKMVASYWGQGP